ncbi:type IV pilus assembly protein PilY1 [Povalibacter uvarum]|uniref:Type IV pilus assembly protein PilY1 n=1 Tax=Povalibacter uvarum TaxID=732238 RepID=A0A841HGP0_9GAMM|nr:PilC/PilY family type IV pilus protein [Povalibacter uvarum]MBB6091843.1 type IV pilus assembly protein PilY1 [Povalibacter uvarum]
MGTARFVKTIYAACAATFVLAAAPSQGAVPLADSPLFLAQQVAPNLIVTLDDSGSMQRAYVPDLCDTTNARGENVAGYDCTLLNRRTVQSANSNPIYYNPAKRYVPAKNEDGTDRGTSFDAAWRNGFDQRTTGGLGTVDLRTQYRATSILNFPTNATAGSESYMSPHDNDLRCSAGRCELRRNSTNWWTSTRTCTNNNGCRNADFAVPAYYYVYVGTDAACTGTDAQKKADDDCYEIRFVEDTVATQDWDGDTDVDVDDQKYNFANWFSFARTRNLATQTATTVSFATLNPDVRVGWQALNSCRGSATNFVINNCAGWGGAAGVSNAIRPFTGTHKTNFFNWVTRLPTANGTPLPAALQRAGEYYGVSGENGPYDNDFSTSNSGELACRRNFHVLMTDGIWNATVSADNEDGTARDLPDGKRYTPAAPYRDGNSPTLSDLAFDYWASDLRSSLPNRIKSEVAENAPNTEYWDPRKNPATWQHMVNFTIGLGLTGYLERENLTWQTDMYGGSYSSLANGSLPWPVPGNDKAANVADLWHTAINSRGRFFSAESPTDLSTAFVEALNDIQKAEGTSAALSANATSLKTGALLFQAKFGANWSGTLLAFELMARGKVDTTDPAWDAAQEIPDADERSIFTHNGTQGIAFEQCSDLSAAQRLALNTNISGGNDGLCADRLAWLRGDMTKDRNRTGGLYRERPKFVGSEERNVMGDIVNSDPAYVKDKDFGYGALAGDAGTTYAAYLANNGTRPGMVYVGSNDGRMYGIRTEGEFGGREQFSYIPEAVFPKLSLLTDPSYSHKYFADGSIQYGDAYLNNEWRTVVVAGLNAGGKAVYALDVTDPENFDESDVLWEFNALDDPRTGGLPSNDLGFTYSRPQIGKLANGTWVAVFGNGYSSTNGGAFLYIVNLQTGALIRKIQASNTSGDESNGLSTPALVDTNNDRMIDTIYAGDLLGNMWRFNVSGALPTAWSVRRLFRATDGTTANLAQPITAQPKVLPHPTQGGQLLLFGTGRYVNAADVTNDARQTFYGIWDDGTTTVPTRANLRAQTFDYQQSLFNAAGIIRSVTNNSVDWGPAPTGQRGWYLDLLDGGSDPTLGERIVHAAQVVQSAVIFGSVIPTTDPCEPGGYSFLYALSFENGGSMNQVVFDTNDDGAFDDSDTPVVNNRDAEDVFVSGVSYSDFGLANVAALIQGTEEGGDSDVTYAELAGTRDKLLAQGLCLTAGGCGEEEEEPPPATTVIKRSWIQIR